jgi:hypothetical protein
VRGRARPEQVFLHLLLGQADVRRHAVVAHELGGVAAEAVIDEVAGAPLQRCLVVDVVVGRVVMHLAAGREAGGGQYHQRGEQHEGLLHVTINAHGR